MQLHKYDRYTDELMLSQLPDKVCGQAVIGRAVSGKHAIYLVCIKKGVGLGA